MSLFRVQKPRPFHHEMIYQGRATGEKKETSRFHFATDKPKEKTKRVIPLELVIIAALVLLLIYLLYM